MKNTSKILFLAFCLISGPLFAQNSQDDILGIWDAGERKVEIHKVDGRYIGNPIDTTGVRRDEVEVLNLEFSKDKWKGKLYAAKKDKLMSVECKIREEELHLRVKSGLLKKTVKWARVE